MSDEKAGEPRAHSTDEISALLRHIETETGMRFELVARFRGGEGVGAYELKSDDGPAVLKAARQPGLTRAPLIANTLNELSARGYPVPTYLTFGTSGDTAYLVQTRLPGAPLNERLAPAHVPTLLALNELQANAPDPLDAWPSPIVDPVLHGGDGFCLLDTMRQHSEATRELLSILQNTVMSVMDQIDSTTDVVHLDFTYSNILAEKDEITGVIDWEATTTGDRAFDLVTLQFYVFNDRATRIPLWNRALEVAGPAPVKAYFAHIIHRQVEWSIRFHPINVFEHFLSLARNVLDELGVL